MPQSSMNAVQCQAALMRTAVADLPSRNISRVTKLRVTTALDVVIMADPNAQPEIIQKHWRFVLRALRALKPFSKHLLLQRIKKTCSANAGSANAEFELAAYLIYDVARNERRAMLRKFRRSASLSLNQSASLSLNPAEPVAIPNFNPKEFLDV